MPLFSSEPSIHSFLTICPSPIKKGKCYIYKEDVTEILLEDTETSPTLLQVVQVSKY